MKNLFFSRLNFNPLLKKEVAELKELVELYDEKLFEIKKKLSATEKNLDEDNFFNSTNT